MHYQATYLEDKGSEKEKYLAANNHLVFNEPVRVVVEYGMLGILLYIGYIYLVFIRNKRFDIVSLTCKSFTLAYLVWGLFSYPNKLLPALLYLTIVTAFIAKREQKKGFTISFNPFLCKSIKIICLAVSIALFIYVSSQHDAYYRFRELQLNRKNMNKKELLRQYAILEPDLSDDVGYTANYTALLFSEKCDSLFVRQLSHWETLHPVSELYVLKGDYFKRMENYRMAEENYWLAHYMAPNKQRARVKLAFLYKETGREKAAKQIADEVLAEKVKIYGFETYRMHRQLEELFGY